MYVIKGGMGIQYPSIRLRAKGRMLIRSWHIWSQNFNNWCFMSVIVLRAAIFIAFGTWSWTAILIARAPSAVWQHAMHLESLWSEHFQISLPLTPFLFGSKDYPSTTSISRPFCVLIISISRPRENENTKQKWESATKLQNTKFDIHLPPLTCFLLLWVTYIQIQTISKRCINYINQNWGFSHHWFAHNQDAKLLEQAVRWSNV